MYTVNLRLAPVECGIKCCNSHGDIRQFTDLNAFNNYFKYLLPEDDGFSLPDVWAGYYHITLGKFQFDTDCDLDTREKPLVNYIKDNSLPEQYYTSIFPCRFRTVELNVHSGAYRHAEGEGTDFVTLKVQDLDNTLDKLYPFLEIIRKGVEKVGGQWQFKSIEDQLNDLHVTVRKYKGNNSDWSSEFIQKCGILERVQQNPLEFECIALDIVQPRREARKRNLTPWWIGATGISLRCTRCGQYFSNNSPGYCQKCRCYGNDHKCSECGRKEEDPISWPGYCRTCQRYERLKPLWSTKPEKNTFE